MLKQAVKAPKAPEPRDDGDAEHKSPGTVKDKILSFVEQVENQDVAGSLWEVTGFVEPGAFKGLSDFLANETKGQGRVEVLGYGRDPRGLAGYTPLSLLTSMMAAFHGSISWAS